MTFLKSILFGYDGSYNIFGTPVTFKSKLPSDSLPLASDPLPPIIGFIAELGDKFLSHTSVCVVTQVYLHLFVHGMSHALAHKILSGENSKLTVCTGPIFNVIHKPGAVHLVDRKKHLVDWKSTIMDVAGPMGSIAFATCKLVAATALKSYLSWPIALALGGGAVFMISGELLVAYLSASTKEGDCFGRIARKNNTHLTLASIAIVSEVALGILLAIKLSR